MTKYIKVHEAYILNALNQKQISEQLLIYHNRQIIWLQHERLVHLLVMLFCISLFILAFVGMLFLTTFPTVLLVFILGILSCAYILHYYRLENSVQRWYEISNQIHFQIQETL